MKGQETRISYKAEFGLGFGGKFLIIRRLCECFGMGVPITTEHGTIHQA